MWYNKIHQVNSLYKDPAKFWNNVKLLMGRKGIKNSYILDRNNTKLQEPKDKGNFDQFEAMCSESRTKKIKISITIMKY